MRVKKCLIIEDEIYLAESIANKLQNSGFETKILSSTREAMELDETFSAVLLSSNLEHEETFLDENINFERFQNVIVSSKFYRFCDEVIVDIRNQ